MRLLIVFVKLGGFDTGRNQIWHRSRFITAVAWSGTTYMDMQCNGSAT